MPSHKPKSKNRRAFPVTTSGDYSARDISARHGRGIDLRKTFFLGTILTDSQFRDVNLSNAEFSEARLTDCDFEGCDFSGADLVDTNLERVRFLNCRFDVGEWRGSLFDSCEFIGCSFAHGTVTLCAFNKCSWDETSFASMISRSVYYNTFSESEFPTSVSSRIFASRNFGIPLAHALAGVVCRKTSSSIEDLCLQNNLGNLRVISLVDVAYAVCDPLIAKKERRGSTLRFFARILLELTRQRRISATSLLYIEDIISSMVYGLDERLTEPALSTLMDIRRALLVIATEHAPQGTSRHEPVTAMSILFTGTYSEQYAEALRQAFVAALDVNMSAVTITRVMSGSTLVEMATTAIVSVAGVLTALNYVLRQAEITLERLGKLKRTYQKNFGKRESRRRSTALAVETSATLAAVADANRDPTLVRLKRQTRSNGRALAEMDEPARVKVLAKPVD